MKLDGYVPGDPGSGQSVARPVTSAALLDLRPHDANTDHARSLPATRCVADMVLARCVARWITEDGLRRGDWHSTVLRGVLYMVLLKNVNKHEHAVARAHIIRLKMTLSCPGHWTTRTYMVVGASAAWSKGRSRNGRSSPPSPG